MELDCLTAVEGYAIIGGHIGGCCSDIMKDAAGYFRAEEQQQINLKYLWRSWLRYCAKRQKVDLTLPVD